MSVVSSGRRVGIDRRLHRQPAFRHRPQQHVERVLGSAVHLLDVEEAADAHALDERSLDEGVGPVALGQDAGRVVVP